MLTSVLQKKRIMRLMALIYLFLSFGTVNATFWCQADENFSHLELNPIGKCWVNCVSDSAEFQQGLTIPQSTSFSLQGDDCLDSPVFTSVLPTSKPTDLLNKSLASSFATTHLPHISELNLEIKGLVNHSLLVYLPEPQTLTALRTVVLLR